MNHASSRSLRYAAVMFAAGSLFAPDAAIGSPARRLARRGVIVEPPAVIIETPPAIVVPPVPAPPWAWRRLGPPGVVVLPPFLGIVPVPPAIVLGPVPTPERMGPGIAAAAPAPTPATPPAAGSPSTSSGPQTTTVPDSERPGSAAQSRKGSQSAAASAAAGGVEAIPAPRPAATAAGDTTDGAAKAFTPTWYARHPEAWKPARMPTSPWKAADVATVASWIGRPVVRADGAADAGQVAQAAAAAPDADGLRSVLVLQSGHGQDGAAADEWLPLGVFAVAPPGGGSAHNYQQLAVDHAGTIRGTFYDAISDTVLPITGAVDKDTLRVAWTVGANGSRFEAAVAAFSTAPRTVSVTSGGGVRDLELVPIDGP